MQGAQSETEPKQEIQQLHEKLIEAQELASTSKQKCFELQGETWNNLAVQGIHQNFIYQVVLKGVVLPTVR